ncbi:MAG: ExbD/TolR family protein [Pseudomonadota bacterium]
MGAAGLKGDGGGGRKRRRGARTGPPMSEINVTPFVDVMLVLLIVFMVSAPFIEVGVPVDLPESQAEELPSEATPPIGVTIDAEGRIYLGGDAAELTLATLRAAALAAAAERDAAPEDVRVYIRAADVTDHGAVARVIAALGADGFTKIAFPTRPGGAEPGS